MMPVRVQFIPRQPFWMVREMFFRPSFCANCGEKIDRAEWGIFTSRRFCQVCESEFKGQDLIPRFIVGSAILFGLFGFGGYLMSGSAPESALIKQPRKFVEQTVAAAPQVSTAKSSNTAGTPNSVAQPSSEIANTVPASRIDARMQERQRPAKPAAEPIEEVYFCGAETRKGTPCRRRVKSNVRCFQHVGMPALVQSDQLRIK